MTTSKPEENPVTAWMERNELSLEQAAQILKTTKNIVYRWRSTEFPKSKNKIKGILAIMENYERRSERLTNLDLDIHLPLTTDQIQRWSIRAAECHRPLAEWIITALEASAKKRKHDTATPIAADAPENDPPKPPPPSIGDDPAEYKPKPKDKK